MMIYTPTIWTKTWSEVESMFNIKIYKTSTGAISGASTILTYQIEETWF